MRWQTRWLMMMTAVVWSLGACLVHAEGKCWFCCKCRRECQSCEAPRQICEEVCETKPIMKTVYRVKEIPYCRHKCPRSCCKECSCACDPCVYTRKVLSKKSVKVGEEKVTTCVVRNVCAECMPTAPESTPLPPIPQSVPTPVSPPKPTREVEAKSASARLPLVKAAAPRS